MSDSRRGGRGRRADLDAVADELLDLHARGGTCVDRALRFVEEEMAGVEATLRVLFVLSDCAFTERADELRVVGATRWCRRSAARR